MATRTIPSDVQPIWSCTINGKRYSYPSGTTMDVPDDVAAVIDAINESTTRPEPKYVPNLPAITDADDGKVVKVSGNRYVLGEDGGGTVDDELSDTSENPVQNKVIKAAFDAKKPYDVIGTLDVDPGENKRITLNVTAEDAYAAFLSGRLMKMTADVSGATVESIGYINSVKLIVGDDVMYQFYFASDKYYASENLSASDNVVLTER